MTRKLYSISIILLSFAFTACAGKTQVGTAGNTSAEESAQTKTKYNQPRKDLGRPKSVLILSSSPRRGGNSEQLCLQFKKGAEETGNTVEMLNINDYDIRYFDQREYDRQASAALTDDAAAIIAKMKEADVIVLSSPVYFNNMTGQMKALIDRVYGYEKDLNGKEFFYISTSTDRSEEGVNCVFDAFHGFAVCLYGSVERGAIKGNGARNRGDINSHPAMQPLIIKANSSGIKAALNTR